MRGPLKSGSIPHKPGFLYLCATPIGNLQDMTLRALRILQEVNLIACEDTRTTRTLLSHFQIATATISYHDTGPRGRKEDLLIRKLKDGETIALVSEAGSPLISDPGYALVVRALQEGIPVEALPGASALIPALQLSGLPPYPFFFGGFLPRKRSERRKLLQSLKEFPYTMVFYESPHRLEESLKEIGEVLEGRRGALVRELTKKFQEVLRGGAEDLLQKVREKGVRGEYTMIFEGAAQGGAGRELPGALLSESQASHSGEEMNREVEEIQARGVSRSEAIRILSKQRGIPRREIYRVVHQKKT